MTFDSDDSTLLKTYCDTAKFPSVKECLDKKYGYQILEKAEAYVKDLTILKASENGDLLAVKIFVLILKDIDIQAKDNFGMNALHVASCFGHLEIVNFLVSKEFDIKAKDNSGCSALHLASDVGHIEVVKFLVENGCDVKATNNRENTASELASRSGHGKVVEFLNSCNTKK